MAAGHALPRHALFADSGQEAASTPSVAALAVGVAFGTRPTRGALVQSKLRFPIAHVAAVLSYSCHLVRVASECWMCTSASRDFRGDR